MVRYQITHRVHYQYEKPVWLSPHVLRMRPRSDGVQQLHHHGIEIDPKPAGITQVLDAEGNAIARCWWSEQFTTALNVTVTSEVSTHCPNPFNYLLEPWAVHLPIDYPTSLHATLEPYYLGTHLGTAGNDSVATQLAQEIGQAVEGNTVSFLTELNLHINRHCRYQPRPTGEPWPPWMTWTRKAGTCRDFVVLFIAACQSVGLAARFVSGYEEGDIAYQSTLHAWAEVYLPGAGWRGYDPTLGVVVSDHHIAVAVGHWPRNTAPVSGSHRGNGGTATLESRVDLQLIHGGSESPDLSDQRIQYPRM